MQMKRTLLATALSAACAGMAMPSFAQIEEVVVTARKAEESLQQTPVAVSAMTEEMLVQAQVTEIADLKKSAPNLSILSGGTGSSALIFIAIRGAAQVSPGGLADAAVGTYIDGVYYARPTGGNVDMFDVQRAEILRGPQGTLFGRNTTGGALNIKTNDPTGEFEGYAKVEAGNYDHRRFEGVLNVPIDGDELAMRFAYRYNEHDGYGDYKGYNDSNFLNDFTWNGFDQDAEAVEENMYGRFKLRWAPADRNFTATFGADWGEFRDTGQRTRVTAINPDGLDGFIGSFFLGTGFNPDRFLAQQSDHDTYWNVDNSSMNPDANWDPRMDNPKSTNKISGAYLDVDVQLGDYDLKSITAYRETLSTGAVDLDGLPVNLLTFYSEWDQQQWSQEFQLSGSWGDLDWTTGLYYFVEDTTDFSVSRFGGDWPFVLPLIDGVPGTSPSTYTGLPLESVATTLGIGQKSTNDGVGENTSKGIFIQANYHFTDALRGTAGLRWTEDTREVVNTSTNYEPGQLNSDVLSLTECKIPAELRDNPGICQRTDEEDFEYPAWVLGLDYQYSENLFLYAKTSGASMAGGWNVRTIDVPAFEPEDAMDVELGFKSDLFDGRVRFNGAFFHVWYDDQQRIVNEFDRANQTTTQYVTNAGQSTAYGAEFELTWLPWDGMTINSSLAFLEAEYDEYEVVEPLETTPDPNDSVLVDHSGEEMPQAPEMTFSLAATQVLDTQLGELELHGDYYWVDETWFQDDTVRPGESAAFQAQQRERKKHNSIDSYGLLNAKATLRTFDGHWEFSLWGRNLTDKVYFTGLSNFFASVGTAMQYYGEPRTYGASVKYNW